MRRFLLITASAVALTVGAGLDAAHAWNNQGTAQHSYNSSMSRDQVTQAQRELQGQGFYQGRTPPPARVRPARRATPAAAAASARVSAR